MFDINSATLEALPRVILVYAGLIVLLRVTGKRQLGQLTPMDLLTMLLLSETVSPALTEQDTSLATALVAAVTLVVCDLVVGYASFRFRRAELALTGTPRIVVRDGLALTRELAAERVSTAELHMALRKNGVASVDDVALATVEIDGEITVVRRE